MVLHKHLFQSKSIIRVLEARSNNEQSWTRSVFVLLYSLQPDSRIHTGGFRRIKTQRNNVRVTSVCAAPDSYASVISAPCATP